MSTPPVDLGTIDELIDTFTQGHGCPDDFKLPAYQVCPPDERPGPKWCQAGADKQQCRKCWTKAFRYMKRIAMEGA